MMCNVTVMRIAVMCVQLQSSKVMCNIATLSTKNFLPIFVELQTRNEFRTLAACLGKNGYRFWVG